MVDLLLYEIMVSYPCGKHDIIEAEVRIYASANKVIIASDNGLSPIRHQSIIRTNVILLLFRPLGTHFSETLIEIQTFSLNNITFNISSATV